MNVDTPFEGAPVKEVHLPRAPLARVVCQVRHPALVALSGEGGEQKALKFANRISQDYPILDRAQEGTLLVTPDGVKERPGDSVTWRLKSADGTWKVSFAAGFVALDTTQYAGRSDFLARLRRVIAEYAEEVQPPRSSRIGIRYTNRIYDQRVLQRLSKLVRPEILGLLATPQPKTVTIAHAVAQIQYELELDHRLLISTAMLPPGAVLDSTLPGVNEISWIFDIDSFAQKEGDFDTDNLNETLMGLGERAYRYFRWAVSNDFLIEFGAER